MKLCPVSKRKASYCTTEVVDFCKKFKQFVKQKACMSLTAPQIGQSISVMAVKYRRPTRVYVLVNPAIKAAGKKLVVSKERTLDVNALRVITKKRPTWVILTYDTPDLKHRRQRLFLGRRAAAALHAYDILQGEL